MLEKLFEDVEIEIQMPEGNELRSPLERVLAWFCHMSELFIVIVIM